MKTIEKQISNFLNSYKLKWWFCGSTTRNMILKRKIKTYNVAVQNTMGQLQTLFSKKIKHIDKNSLSLKISYKNIDIILFPLKKITFDNYVKSYEFTTDLKEDALSKDFNINTIYYNPVENKIIDPLNNRKTIIKKELSIVGNAENKIIESKIILLRSATLLARIGKDWKLNEESINALFNQKLKILAVPKKQIHKELIKLFYESETPSIAFDTLRETGILNEFFPELERCIGIPQNNKSKNLDLYKHIMLAMDSIPPFKANSIILRIAALLHDIGKPYTQIYTNTGIHFYNHETIGAFIAEKILYRWGFNKLFIEKIKSLIKNHLFDAKLKSTKSIKKLILRVGVENIHLLLDLRISDRFGTGRKNISMDKVEKLRDKVNKILGALSPENIKLNITNEEINEVIKNNTYFIDKTIKEINNYLVQKIIISGLKNKQSILIKEIEKINEIKCPLDKPHLFKTWADITKGEPDTFPNGKLSCGVFCNFLCDSVLNKNYS